MSTWTIHGREFGNCNCAYGCPCQFHAPTTHGFCEAAVGGIIDEGHFEGTDLAGVNWVLLLQWPGEIADGNGRQQAIVDERASAEQREAVRKILHGEATAPGSTHFYVYNSTMSEVLETVYAPVDVDIDVDARKARILASGLVEIEGFPITDPFSGEEFHAAIQLPHGFEYTIAQMGSGTTRASAGLAIELSGTYGQFNELHLNQDGVIR